MSMRRSVAFALAAGLTGVLAMGCAGVAGPGRLTWEPPPVADCGKLPQTCKALERAVAANDELRIAYLTDVGACREGACKPKVKPFDAGTDAGVLRPMLTLSLETCLTGCDRSHVKDTPGWQACRQACYGTP